MARNTTPSFIATIPLICSDSDCNYLNKLMRMCNKINNTLVKHVRRQLYYLNEDKAFVELRDKYYKENNKSAKNILAEAYVSFLFIFPCRNNGKKTFVPS